MRSPQRDLLARQRARAFEMRREGRSYDEIARTVFRRPQRREIAYGLLLDEQHRAVRRPLAGLVPPPRYARIRPKTDTQAEIFYYTERFGPQ